ncbi:hypothetical protein GDO78_008909 [Eleutherodactylus coqui]|uniref:Uncharacterized protein n=1 Tax=Eleutherodactylus coqui TaxID=57060 RepID=A0A8J6KBE3_ELECQ|nr:hypothetical protein GDO78_008909 [Eleutherodactylus coqui]
MLQEDDQCNINQVYMLSCTAAEECSNTFVNPSSGDGDLELVCKKIKYYKIVGIGVGEMCSFGAYLAKNGKNTDNMTPTIASM